MARNWAHDWRRLALAGVTAVALALACGAPAEAQATKKAKKKAPEAEQAQQEGEPKAPEKKKKMTAAEAQQAVDAAVKLLEAGKTEQAAQSLTSTLAAGRLPPAIMAKALLYRGIAYRQQKKPAQAIADLTSALWLKGGLGESERKDALSQRSAAYQEAGLTESGEPIAAAAVPPAPRTPTRTAAASPPSETAAPPPSASLAPAPAAESQSSGVWNPFGNLFGGPSATPAPAAPPAAAPPAPAPSAAAILGSEPQPVPVRTPESRPKSARSAWTSNTEVRAGPAPTETASLPPKADGKFRVQVGMVRTQDQARQLAGKVKSQYAAAFGQREPQIDEAVVGNMGSFYRVRVGPFASQQEGQAACAKLKGSGLDCLVVTQ